MSQGSRGKSLDFQPRTHSQSGLRWCQCSQQQLTLQLALQLAFLHGQPHMRALSGQLELKLGPWEYPGARARLWIWVPLCASMALSLLPASSWTCKTWDKMLSWRRCKALGRCSLWLELAGFTHNFHYVMLKTLTLNKMSMQPNGSTNSLMIRTRKPCQGLESIISPRGLAWESCLQLPKQAFRPSSDIQGSAFSSPYPALEKGRECPAPWGSPGTHHTPCVPSAATLYPKTLPQQL